MQPRASASPRVAPCIVATVPRSPTLPGLASGSVAVMVNVSMR